LRRIVIVLAAALAVAATFALPAEARTMGLKGEVNDNFQIKLTKNGVRVKTLKAGTYLIKIEDESSGHNFRLRGPRLDKATSVAFIGERTWRVTLKKGRYTIQCDPHALNGMRSTFTVTA
jgi:plastocyanin